MKFNLLSAFPFYHLFSLLLFFLYPNFHPRISLSMNSTTGFLSALVPTSFFNDPWSDEAKSMWVPIVAYWAYSITFQFIMQAEIPFFEQYRIHTSEDMKKRNRVTLSKVLLMVAAQQTVQFIIGVMLIQPSDDPVKQKLEQEAFTASLAAHIYNVLAPYTPSIAAVSDQIAWGLYNVVWPSVQFFLGM